MATSQKSNYGQFLPVSQLQTYQELFDFADNAAYVINTKTSGWFVLEEVMNGELLFPTINSRTSSNVAATYRQVFRKLVNFGTLPNNGTKTVAHGLDIDENTRFKTTYGDANDPINLLYKPLPYASPTLAQNIALDVNSTNVTITTGANQTNFTDVYIVLEYVKQA